MTENWKTSTYSGPYEECVEARLVQRMVEVRDTKTRDRGAVRFGEHPWLAFLSGGWEI